MREVYGKAVASIESVDDDKFGPNGGFTAVLSTPSEDRDGDRLMQQEWKEFTQERYPLDIDHGMSVADTVGSFVPYFEGEKMMMDAFFASTPKAQEVRTLVDEKHVRSVSVAFMTDKTKKSGEPQRELLNAGIVAIPSNRDAVILASKAASALRDAFSDATEGEVPEEVKAAVLAVLEPEREVQIRSAETGELIDLADAKTGDLVEGVTKDVEEPAEKKGAIYIDVVPRLDEDALKRVLAEVTKAAATASGVGGDGALVQAIHDASSHLGAACPVIEVTDEGTGASDGANKGVDSQEAFEKALDEVLSPEDSPAEAAAATDEVPAPAVDAADDVALEREASALRLRLLASE